MSEVPSTSPAPAVARVVLDVPLAHLDRPFDYAVPPAMDAEAVPGARVVARFAGRERHGFVVERPAASEHDGPLTPLRRVVSPVPVLTPEVLALARAVADATAGTLSDVLRLAIPPRHARTEAAALRRVEPPATQASPAPSPWQAPWADYVGGPAFIRRLAAGESPRAVWSALPGTGRDTWEAAVAAAAGATAAAGRGVVVVVPGAREVDRVSAALDDAALAHVRLRADDGPSARYRAFLEVLLGRTRIVVGTRSAAFAPVADLGLVVCWDDGDDLLAEPRAPYPHALRVLTTRADLTGAAALVGGWARSTVAQQLLEDGWAKPVQAERGTVRRRAPLVSAPTEADLAREGPAAAARVPHPAWEVARRALAAGPVLVQVPRAGYVPLTACVRCRSRARCGHCHGPLRVGHERSAPACGWCGRLAADWRCPTCGETRLRAVRVGSARTAEELGRAMPGVPVIVSGTSGPDGVVPEVGSEPRLVVATPGAEPVADGGYAAALLLDAAVTTGRPELWASEEALRRWFGAAALVRSAPEGGRVMLLGHGAAVPAQALVRWDPGGFAARELAERAELGFWPAVTMASVEGPAPAVAAFLRHVPLPAGAEILGPVPVETRAGEGTRAPRAGDGAGEGGAVRQGGAVREGGAVRAVLRLDRHRGIELARALAQAAAVRSARKEDPVRVQVDPSDLW